MKNVLLIGSSPEHSRENEFIPYQEALLAAGIRPVVLSPLDPISLEDFSGLVLMGGTDVNPARYGEPRNAATQEPDDRRDEAELAAIDQALSRDLPLLAICRGLQILNVSQEGTLVQHIDNIDRHRRKTEDKSLPAHGVEIVPGTRLAQITGETRSLAVNSRHHQAIAHLGNDLKVAARDPLDRTIEAVEMPDRRFVLAVQWHPENMAFKDEQQARLFNAFSEALE